MAKGDTKAASYRKSISIFVAAAVLLLSFLIIRPFIVSLLSAAVLAYIFYPVYLFFMKIPVFKKRSKEISAMLTCMIVISVVLLPVIVLSNLVITEIKGGYVYLQDYLSAPQISFGALTPLVNKALKYLPQFKSVIYDAANQLISVLQYYLINIPNLVVNIVIIIFSTYYFLKHGKDLHNYFSELIPLPHKRFNQILQRFDDLSRGMIVGQLLVGVIQGVLAWIAFLLLGVPNPLLFGFLTVFISIIPLLGAAIVWAPIVIYLGVIGSTTGEYWRAFVLLLYGSLVISTIDNVLKPKIVGSQAKIHPLIILIGVLGGIQLFGIPGILIGPIILAIFDLGIEIYKETL
jgi:predicted PurR-regulated permease PerM